MNRYRLTGSRMIDPYWLNSLGYAQKHKTTFSSDKIILDGQTLYPKGEIPLDEGEEIYVWVSDHFYCCSVREYEKHKQKVAEEKERKERELEERRNKIKLSNQEFNDSLNIPFKWITAIKPVLSGLTERSSGTGANRRTVTHIMVKEDIEFGRFKRDKDDYLCTKYIGQYGSNPEEPGEIIDGKVCLPRITCKQCLDRVAKLTK